MRTFFLLSLLSNVAFAQGWQQRAQDHRAKLAAERKQLGLDKGQAFPTPEVKFVGSTGADGLLGVLCPGEKLKVTLDGVPPKSLVAASIDDVVVKEDAWAGSRWSGVLTTKPGASPRLFSLVAVVAPSGREAWSSSYLLGCKRTLTLTVDGATLTLALDLRARSQSATGEWKKSGKTLGTRSYEVQLTESGVRLASTADAAELERNQGAIEAAMKSPRALDLDKRFNAAMKRLEACGKNQATMVPCMQAVQPELQKLTAERTALNAELERAMTASFGCAEADLDADASATGCAGHGRSDRVPATFTW